MNHRIIEIDGRIILLDRIDDWDEEQPHRLWMCTWLDDLNRYDEHCAHPSLNVVKAQIATFDEATAREFLQRADVAFEKRLAVQENSVLIGPP